MPTPDVTPVVTVYSATTAAVRRRVLTFIRRTWGELGAYYDADIERFVAAVVPVVEAGQRQVAALTDAYLATVAQVVLGRAVPVGVNPTDVGIQALRGTPADEVYTRPGITTWLALHDHKPLRQAVEEGLNRALDLAASDLQLAKTHTARRHLMADGRANGYRRVLEGAHSCGLCIVASTQRYHKADLLPIHPGCDCGVLPIYGGGTDRVIDEQSLADVHAAIQERFGVSDAGARTPDYRKVLLVRQHGELGPVLTVKSHRFTSEAQIAS